MIKKINNNINKWLVTSGLFALIIFLSGCVQRDSSGQATGKGWVYNLLVKPMSGLIQFFVNNWGWSVGLSIVVITLLVRLLIMPLGLYQAKKSTIQSEKMAALKPQLDKIQAKQKTATTQEEQIAVSAEMQRLYKENGVSMFGGITGCLPLFIQMPFFSALYFTAQYAEGVNESVFLGVNLGERSWLFIILAGLGAFLQGFISYLAVPDDQKKMMKSTLFMSPIMIILFSLNVPAGVSLYWVVSGFVGCLQTAITTFYHKPKIRKQVAEELKNNPIKEIVTDDFVKKAEPVSSSKPKNRNQQNTSGTRRNEGKQRPR